jgi:hypothetical protein
MKKLHSACQSHCCVLHGCKYGYEDCPVVTKKVKQDHRCESCEWEGYADVNIVEMIANGIKDRQDTGWVIIHPNGKYELDYFHHLNNPTDKKGNPITIEQWRKSWRPDCRFVKMRLKIDNYV